MSINENQNKAIWEADDFVELPKITYGPLGKQSTKKMFAR